MPISQEQTCAQFTPIQHHAVTESSSLFPVSSHGPAVSIAMQHMFMQQQTIAMHQAPSAAVEAALTVIDQGIQKPLQTTCIGRNKTGIATAR